jgi:hypothetical protein
MLDERFVQGRTKFFDQAPALPEPTAKIYVRVGFPGQSDTYLAQLDTGAAWSILPTNIARTLGISSNLRRTMRLSTRFGVYLGGIVRLPFTFVADDGESLDTEGTFFLADDWPWPIVFLGYSGLLDKIRFALDPQKNHFYFGA